MRHVKFYPWEGENYFRAPFGKRVLILGESHYEWKGSGPIDDHPTLTQDLIEDQLAGRYKIRFWTHIAVAFLNKVPTLAEKREFWHSVAFYNYVQQSAGAGARVRPAANMWRDSEIAFNEVLETLKPEALLVLGYDLWKHLPRPLTQDESLPTLAGSILTRAYSYNGGACRAFSVRHPSSGFNGRSWHPKIMAGLRSIT